MANVVSRAKLAGLNMKVKHVSAPGSDGVITEEVLRQDGLFLLQPQYFLAQHWNIFK